MDGTLPSEAKRAWAIKIKLRQYAKIGGVLYRKSFLEPWLQCVGPLQAEYVVRKIHEGSCIMHSGLRSVVAKAIGSGYYWPTMHKDALNIIRKCDDCQVHHPIPKNPQQKLTPITSPWPFYKWGIDISGPFPKAQGKVKFLIVAIDYFTKWIEAKAVEIGMPSLRCAKINQAVNDETLLLNLDVLKEEQEKAVIQEAKSKARMERYYNGKIRSIIFKPGDFVYLSNEASHAKDNGKLGPKWEGPYEIVEALGKGVYKIRNGSGDILLRT
ncbi:reverse transcriptase domain-containing protein [Tanacetum coccineum]